MRIRFQVVLLALVFLKAASALALTDISVRTVAITGSAVPDAPDGTTFVNFGVPSINEFGFVAFRAEITGSTVSQNDNSGIWSEGSGSLAIVARENSSTPSSIPSTYSNFDTNDVVIGDGGKVTWLGNHILPQGTSRGVWIGDSASVQLVASAGFQAPGLPANINFLDFSQPYINAQNELLVSANVTGPHPSIWKYSNTNLSLVARRNDPIPGQPGFRFGLLYSARQLNDVGQIAFATEMLQFEFPNTVGSHGLWLVTNGNFQPIARDFDPAPGGSPGNQFNIDPAAELALNSLGEVTFTASFRTGGSINSSNDGGIWSSKSGQLELIVREGSDAPGTVLGSKFSAFLTPKMNDNGNIAFIGTLQTDSGLGIDQSNSSAIWSDWSGSLEVVARSGDLVPGSVPGVSFARFFGPTAVRPTMNSQGHIAFMASLTGPNVTSANSFGLFAQDPTGDLRMLLRTGDAFEITAGDVRQIQSLSQIGSYGGGIPFTSIDYFTDDYQLPVRITFTDGTAGVFVVGFSVPEPGGLGLSLLAFSGLFVRFK